jgi:hypothetical protein
VYSECLPTRLNPLAERARFSQVCRPCPNGTQSNEGRTACQVCPSGTAGTGGSCQKCKQIEGEVPNTVQSSCVCPPGTYDSWVESHMSPTAQDNRYKNQSSAHHIYCWSHAKQMRADGTTRYEADPLNDPSKLDLQDMHKPRCITCPACVSCPVDGGQVILHCVHSLQHCIVYAGGCDVCVQ